MLIKSYSDDAFFLSESADLTTIKHTQTSIVWKRGAFICPSPATKKMSN